MCAQWPGLLQGRFENGDARSWLTARFQIAAVRRYRSMEASCDAQQPVSGEYLQAHVKVLLFGICADTRGDLSKLCWGMQIPLRGTPALAGRLPVRLATTMVP